MTTADLIKVPFDDGEILCIQDGAGEHVVLKPLCDRLGVDSNGQGQRLKRAAWAKGWTCMMHVQLPGDGQRREVFCLARKRLAMWLATIDTDRVKEEVRPYLEALQERAADVLDAYFMGARVASAAELDEALATRVDDLEQETAAIREVLVDEIAQLRNDVAKLKAAQQRQARTGSIKNAISAQMEMAGLEQEGPTVRDQVLEVMLKLGEASGLKVLKKVPRRYAAVYAALHELVEEGLIERLNRQRWRVKKPN